MTRKEFLELLLACDGAVLGRSQWQMSRPAIWRDGREIAHWEGRFIDLRLRKSTLLTSGLPAVAIIDSRRDWTSIDVGHVDAKIAANVLGAFGADTGRTKGKRPAKIGAAAVRRRVTLATHSPQSDRLY